MTKRPKLFSGSKLPAAPPSAPEPPAPVREALSTAHYPKATTREGKRVVTAYLEPGAFRQLKRIGVD